MPLRPLRPDDRGALAGLLDATGAFTAEEVAVALELIDSDDPDYRFIVADADGATAGYVCFGPVPLTDGAWDLYWFVVMPEHQSRGVGTELIRAAEAAATAERARMLLVETSSQPSYAATRAFYDRSGYTEVARVPDFYAPGDDKVVYCRRLD